MTGINSYSTTPSENVQANTGIDWDEGMSPGAVNNSARQNMADIRSQWNDASWFQYGIGSLPVATVYASATSFTLAGDDATGYWHTGRRVKAMGSATGTIYGTVSSSAFATSTTTINVIWDSGSLSNETLIIYASTIPVTGCPVPPAGVPGLSGRNRIINGDFRINQRGYASGAALASGAYGHDRWKAGAAGGDYSFTQNKSDTIMTIAAGKSLQQVIEDVNIEGGTYVLSWSGTAQGRVAVSGGATSGSYAASPLVVTGAGACEIIAVEFNTGTLGKVQLEPGAVATPFERIAYATLLQICQRYYQSIFPYLCGVQGQDNGNRIHFAGTTFPVPMRSTPSASMPNGYTMGIAPDSTYGVSISSTTAVTPTSISLELNVAGPGGGVGYSFFGVPNSGTPLNLSAEI